MGFQTGLRRVRRVFAIFLLVTLAVWITGFSSALAAKPQPAPEQGAFEPAWTPLGLSTAPINVVAQLAGDPVTVTSSNSASRMSDEEKDQLQGQIKASQQPIERQIESIGGTVLADYQLAYNGIKVNIAGNKVRDLAKLPGVVTVHRLKTYEIDNTKGVPYIGAPQAWDGTSGFHGEGVKVAIIDTGIDYTHADFGGPGTVGAWQNAFGKSTLDPTLLTVCETATHKPCFGPNAPRVKGGYDFVGDSYNADPTSSTAPYQPIPHPDPNPLDCAGHGSHVAGTAAGSGVLVNGSTYTGTYDAATISSHSWNVGPGVAPKADLYALRVFGCNGSTDVVVDAIEWAVAHHMDVINMSLGSPFGTADDPDATAATNAAKDGLIVVSASGNAGSNPYITSSPGSGTYGISVAAIDSTDSFPGALLTFSGTPTVTVRAINANGAALPGGAWPLVELKDAGGNLSKGCVAGDYTKLGVADKVVITRRGTCARVARAIFGQQAGAKAVIMVNSSDSFPPYEGPITENPDDHIAYNVTIPFLGVPSSAKTALEAAATANKNVSLTDISGGIPNPGFRKLASFTSFGPRSGDSAFKPDVTAPGVSIASVGMGTGNKSAFNSGTSMATPHTAGMAALVRQAHPDWKPEYWKAAIVSTADPSLVSGYNSRGAGTGVIQAQKATKTQVVALGDPGTSALSFGFKELDTNYNQSKNVKLTNLGNSTATFTVSSGSKAGSTHSVALGGSSVTVPAHESINVKVSLSVPVATAGDSTSFHSVRGMVTFTPGAGQNNGVTLRVPYYLVPNAVSHANVKLDAGQLADSGTATATLTNSRGAAKGFVDWFALGLTSDGEKNVNSTANSDTTAELGSAGLRAAGVQSYPTEQAPSDPTSGIGWLQFAIGTTARWSNPSENEFDIFLDLNGDGIPDYAVIVADLGLLTTGSFNGQDAIAVFALKVVNGALKTDGLPTINYLAGATTDGSSVEVPVDFSQLCVDGHPCLSPDIAVTYTVESFGLINGTFDSFTGSASFNAFTPVFTTSGGSNTVTVPVNGTATDTISFNRAQAAKTPVLGVMVVSQNNPNRNGRGGQIQLISFD